MITLPWVARLGRLRRVVQTRIAVMVLITVAVGFVVGQQGPWVWDGATSRRCGMHGLGLPSSPLVRPRSINGGNSRPMRRMRRTRSRPLPAGRLNSNEVLVLGTRRGGGWQRLSCWQVNLLTAVMTAITFVLYAGVYTPLKRWTSLCTAVGAIPGALPPVLGWTAAGQSLDWTAFALFAVMFILAIPAFPGDRVALSG